MYGGCVLSPHSLLLRSLSEGTGEETEAETIFLLNWAHKRWNPDLAKNISRPEVAFETSL